MSSSVFQGRWRLCAEVTSEGKPFQTRGAATPKRLDRRLFSVWSAGRPVWLDADWSRLRESSSTLPTASLSPGILVPCYCGSGTQEPPDGTRSDIFVWGGPICPWPPHFWKTPLHLWVKSNALLSELISF